MPPVAKVLPLVTARGLPGELDYLEESGAEVGTVVRIPLGGRAVDGIVVGRADETDVPAEKLVRPRSVVPYSVPQEAVGLAYWMAQEYCSTFARSVSLMLPPPLLFCC